MALPTEGLSLGVAPLDEQPLPQLGLPTGDTPISSAVMSSAPGGSVPPSGLPIQQPPQAPQTPQLPAASMAPPQMAQMAPTSSQNMRGALQQAAAPESNRFYGAFSALAGADRFANTKALASFDQNQMQLAQQQQKMQMGAVKDAVESLGNFAKLDKDVQRTSAAAFLPGIKAMFDQAGIPLSMDAFAAMALRPGVAETALQVFFSDPAMQDKHDFYAAQANAVKESEVGKTLQGFVDERVKELTPQIADSLAQNLPLVRANLKIAPGGLVPAQVLMTGFMDRQEYRDSPVMQRVLHNLINDASWTKQMGIGMDNAAMEAEQKKSIRDLTGGSAMIASEWVASPEWVKAQSDLKDQFSGRNPTDFETYYSLPAKTRLQIQSRALDAEAVRMAQGRKTVELDQPLPASQRNNYVTLSGLNRGILESPPMGITVRDNNKISVDISTKQREQLGKYQQAADTLDSLHTTAKTFITARNAADAWKQGANLSIQAAKRDTIPFSYQEAVDAFLGPLARSVSSEVGVLTDGDISRIRGLLTRFTDTQQTMDFKYELVKNIMNLNRLAILEQIKGGDLEEIRKKYKGQLEDKIFQIELSTNVGPDNVVIYKDRNIRMMPKNDKAGMDNAKKLGWTVRED